MKACLTCSKELIRPRKWSLKQYEAMKYCGHPCFFKKHSHNSEQEADSFYSRVYEMESGCHAWVGPRCENGYGMWSRKLNGKRSTIRAHRFAWILRNKKEIPEKMLACHTCDNPWCVNPDHIFIGSHKDNSEDMIKKNRGVYLRGSESNSAKLSLHQIEEIILSKEPATKLCRKHGVSATVIRNVRTGKSYRSEVEQAKRLAQKLWENTGNHEQCEKEISEWRREW